MDELQPASIHPQEVRQSSATYVIGQNSPRKGKYSQANVQS
jgi:hypothetical protein